MKKENLNRRDFIKTSFKTIAIGSLALSSLDIKRLLAETSNGSEISAAAKVIKLSDYPDLANVGGYVVMGKAIVIRVAQSKFIALNMVCTHKKCDLDYNGSSFECPCHGSTFDRNGKVTSGPATKNLRSYKTSYNAQEDTLTINM